MIFEGWILPVKANPDMEFEADDSDGWMDR
jgi:hypothetical protein